MPLLPSEKAQYSAIIDDIIAKGDLTTISAKQIRKGLQDAIEKDLSDQKLEIKELIMERFDKASTDAVPVASPPVNGHFKTEVKAERAESTPPAVKSEDSEVDDSPPKKKRKSKPVDDAELAAMLQAQENSRARPTRGGEKRKAKVVKKPRKKSAKKVKADDSDVELNSEGEPKEKEKKGGFHKLYILSAPLAELVGEPTLSRPQVVKKIWAYIKERDLQDPSDKRNIICDNRMQAVFKQDKVHMFTMNKILGKQLYDVEE
ncbi:hypothetical protein BP5796_09237 [Coleophoma crateriformis]|uniref:Uncharacterized protein n=1 Tax=Coleophoma crateriformis TaxID=565419 RepID=A0A3D8R3P5_9HELO|nr:hypothetical protein BP5796_09237 [Coleophoma crateriformis]